MMKHCNITLSTKISVLRTHRKVGINRGISHSNYSHGKVDTHREANRKAQEDQKDLHMAHAKSDTWKRKQLLNVNYLK